MQAELCPENMVNIMLRNEESWTTIAQTIVAIQRQLRNAERARVRSHNFNEGAILYGLISALCGIIQRSYNKTLIVP